MKLESWHIAFVGLLYQLGAILSYAIEQSKCGATCSIAKTLTTYYGLPMLCVIIAIPVIFLTWVKTRQMGAIISSIFGVTEIAFGYVSGILPIAAAAHYVSKKYFGDNI